MKTTRLRVTSDGTPGGTKVMTEDGTLVKGVQFANWHLDLSGHARLQIEVSGVAADVVGLVEVEDASFLEDPTALVSLDVPQDPPEGPGFTEEGRRYTEGGVVRAIAETLAPEVRFEPGYVCTVCGTLHDDVDMFCTGDDIIGTHQPFRVVPKEDD